MGFEKFDQHSQGQYWTHYFEKDTDFYNTIKKHMRASFVNGKTVGIDIGAGPGVGARLLASLPTQGTLIGFEPSATCSDGQKLSQELSHKNSQIKYIAKRGRILDIKKFNQGEEFNGILFDYILLLRAAHEIAESLGG